MMKKKQVRETKRNDDFQLQKGAKRSVPEYQSGGDGRLWVLRKGGRS